MWHRYRTLLPTLEAPWKKTVICRSLLPKANGGGDRGVHVHSQRVMQSIFCSVHGDTVTLVFQLFASHAGRQELSAWFFLPARARVNLQKSLSPVSPCHPEAGYFGFKTQRLTIQKSVTYKAKVRDLRRIIHWLTNTRTKKIYEKVWATMSKYEQLWIAPSPFPYLCNVVQRYAALPISKTGEDIWWNRLFYMPCDPNQQAVPHYSKL